ncbi:MAG: hypothetical protein KIT80_13375 [Chitinophagaceae bacterium]|nr:hypothetical protein [Chitinophagaceae bacterium]MCW5927899.1 hypothetical protein [Chitinophagaceae bacterium]
MCRFRNWYSDENGYVIQCEDCCYFQVSFGTTMLTMSKREYLHFAEMVSDKRNCYPAMQDANCKCIILPTRSESVHIILSSNELTVLHEMVQQVDIEMRTRELINLF